MAQLTIIAKTKLCALAQNPDSRELSEQGGEARRRGADPLLDQFAPPLGQKTDLAFLLVDVDANMIHGWFLRPAASTASSSCGAAFATTSSGRPAAS